MFRFAISLLALLAHQTSAQPLPKAATALIGGHPLHYQRTTTFAAYSPKGNFSATVRPNPVTSSPEWNPTNCYIEDLKNSKSLWSIRSESPIRAVTFSSDEQWVATLDRKGQAQIYEVHTGKLLRSFGWDREFRDQRNTAFHSLRFTRDGRYLFAGIGSRLRKYDVLLGAQTGEANFPVLLGTLFLISPDGKYLISQAGPGILVLDASTLKIKWAITTFVDSQEFRKHSLTWQCKLSTTGEMKDQFF